MAMPGSDWYFAETYATLIRFGMWDEMLAEAPAERCADRADCRLSLWTGGGSGCKGRTEDARAELTGLEKIAAAVTADDSAGLNAAGDVLVLAVLVAEARIADAQQHSTDTIALLTEASAKEDSLAYDEPSDWFFPVRHMLGARCCGPARPRRQKMCTVRTSAVTPTTAGRCTAWHNRSRRNTRKPMHEWHASALTRLGNPPTSR